MLMPSIALPSFDRTASHRCFSQRCGGCSAQCRWPSCAIAVGCMRCMPQDSRCMRQTHVVCHKAHVVCHKTHVVCDKLTLFATNSRCMRVAARRADRSGRLQTGVGARHPLSSPSAGAPRTLGYSWVLGHTVQVRVVTVCNGHRGLEPVALNVP